MEHAGIEGAGNPSPGARGMLGLPGIPVPASRGVPARAAAPRPRTLRAPGSLLLAGVTPGRPVGLPEHLNRWGALPPASLDQLVRSAEREGLRGAGGAAFPTARKLESLAGRRVSQVVVNGAEGESASGKDGVLLGHVPHLVLDGAIAAARALRAGRVVVRVGADRPDLVRGLPAVLAERGAEVTLELSVGPAGFVAGEATAVLSDLAGGPAIPRDLGKPPRDPARARLRRQNALVSNVETFARLAVALRGGRAASCLASASGAVAEPGVVELGPGSTVAQLAHAVGGVVGVPAILITGGWHGRWVPWDAATANATLDPVGMAGIGGRWGAGALVWVPGDLPPGRALAAVADELARGTAGQCGPCAHGLPELSRVLGALDDWPAPRLGELMDSIDGRGTCAHPTASVAALRSGLELIGAMR